MTPSTATNSLKPTRRTYAAADKSRILEEYDAASTPLERASIMRREGVYASLIAYWLLRIIDSGLATEGFLGDLLAAGMR